MRGIFGTHSLKRVLQKIFFWYVQYTTASKRTYLVWGTCITEQRNIYHLQLLVSSNGLTPQSKRILAEQANQACFLSHERISWWKEIDICSRYWTGPTYSLWWTLVKKSTQNDYVCDELGRFTMPIDWYTTVVAYWLRVFLVISLLW